MLSIVVAVAKNNVIGNKGDMPWRLPGDLRYFRRLTDGHAIIMGRKTFESLPGLLPNRRHIVITGNPNYMREGIEIAGSLAEAAEKAPNAFVIGGGSLYREALELCEYLYITEIDAEFEGDVFFPVFDKLRYELMEKSEYFCENGINYRFTCYRRR